MSLTEKFIDWCADQSPTARFERTLAQGVISVVATELPQQLAQVQLPGWVSGLIIPCCMAVLSIIQAEFGKNAADFSGGGTDA